MDHQETITSEPGKRSGNPCIRGTRMTVTDVLGTDFPDLTRERMSACLAVAAGREPQAGHIACMKLLFDQNLCVGLSRAMEDVYPGGVHVRDIGMSDADDKQIWDYALFSGFTIVSKDSDFLQRVGNCGNTPRPFTFTSSHVLI